MHKNRLGKLSILLLLISFSHFISATSLITKYKTCFTPPNNCSSIIINEINEAKDTIYIQAYGFTHAKIIASLIEAKKRGVDVQIILDRSNFTTRYKLNLDQLSNAGIIVFKDKASGIAHNKIMIIDQQTVITGSFNFTKNADTKNAENIIVLDDIAIASEYYQNWLSRGKSRIINN